ncbi:esterase, partial [Myxococcota bacterium]|nr:esterase [Myxococcota bacterium]
MPTRPSRPPLPVHGTVAPGFLPLREAFARNLHQEAGAALCVHVDGRIVADL